MLHAIVVKDINLVAVMAAELLDRASFLMAVVAAIQLSFDFSFGRVGG